MSKKPQSQTFEVRMERLQEVVTALEKGELPLEQGVELYKEGMELARACRGQLDKARNDIRIYTEEGLKSFVPSAEEEGEEA